MSNDGTDKRAEPPASKRPGIIRRLLTPWLKFRQFKPGEEKQAEEFRDAFLTAFLARPNSPKAEFANTYMDALAHKGVDPIQGANSLISLHFRYQTAGDRFRLNGREMKLLREVYRLYKNPPPVDDANSTVNNPTEAAHNNQAHDVNPPEISRRKFFPTAGKKAAGVALVTLGAAGALTYGTISVKNMVQAAQSPAGSPAQINHIDTAKITGGIAVSSAIVGSTPILLKYKDEARDREYDPELIDATNLYNNLFAFHHNISNGFKRNLIN